MTDKEKIEHLEQQARNLRTALEHAKREFYLRGRRDIVHEMINIAEASRTTIDLADWYNQAADQMRQLTLPNDQKQWVN
ncbi:MAG: hypothetical protein MJA83_05850 [Gammaproteobacteria bacterium]|nr:hypothetical protein [Gammaproteobacteria bacterium]